MTAKANKVLGKSYPNQFYPSLAVIKQLSKTSESKQCLVSGWNVVWMRHNVHELVERAYCNEKIKLQTVLFSYFEISSSLCEWK